MHLLTQRAHRRPISRVAAVAAGALVLGLAGYAAPAGASPAASPSKTDQPPGAVLGKPAPGTPQLVNNTGRHNLNRITQMVQCGDTMYAVGIFNTIVQGGTDYARTNIFSFQADAPYTITSWAPQVNGTINTITFNAGDCDDAYIGGNFTSVNGTTVKNIAEIDTVVGDVVPTFGTSTAGGQVETMLAVDGHILVGGYFQWINGSHADPFMASVDPVTGKDDGFLHLAISGHYDYCDDKGKCTQGENSSVQLQQLSHSGNYDLVEGDFTSVAGLQREQIFMLDLTTDPATVTPWTSSQWDGSDPNQPYQCVPVEAWYIRAAAWSPDDSTIYIGDTGNHPNNLGTFIPRSGLCDAVASFPATLGPVSDNWIEYSGCDSYYSIAADDGAVYAAGHPRWVDNSDGCDNLGSGGIKDFGLQGLDPSSGNVDLKTSGQPVYTMSRANASNMLITTAGLWIGSSNRFGSQSCGLTSGHSGICFLPYPTP
ncbi:MAG TPA: hypothetical protein VHY58_00890 [Streptosporangiaceae bacterium]|jgi:hypothetical protein|nr:hypothetical protein [Streptosporangiaceae bacterium]